VDEALPRSPADARPDIRMIHAPLALVRAFLARRFPHGVFHRRRVTPRRRWRRASVVVKGHSPTPARVEIVAEAIQCAVQNVAFHPGVFPSSMQTARGGFRRCASIRDQAVGFTGPSVGAARSSTSGAQRPEPHPFFGEISSVNPIVRFWRGHPKTAGTGNRRGLRAGSLTMGAGQFCTNPDRGRGQGGREGDRPLSRAAKDALLSKSAHKSC